MTEPTPGPVEILSKFIEFRLAKLHTCAPARVVAFDAAKNQVTVQPLFLRVFVDAAGEETIIPAPIQPGVPVLFPRGGGFAITWDLVPGDIVMLLAAERSIDLWARDGGMVDPKPRRKHDQSDVIAIPGVAPEVSAIAGIAPNELRLGSEDGSAEIRINRANGKIQVTGLTVELAGGGPAVGRVGDYVTIDSASDPAFFAWISALSPVTVAPYPAPIKGRISTGSPKVTSG